jgi:RNA polymerase sigma factor (sigma-70 family)
MYPVSKGALVPSPPDAPAARRQRRFDDLYAANQQAILGYLLRRTDSTDDAADVFAETFLTAWRRLDEIPPGPQARLWLYGAARRTLANFRRGARRRLALADRLRSDLALSYQPAEPAGQFTAIAAAFRRLPEPDRELLALVAWEGLDPGQISAVLGCSRNAVRIRLHRARRKLASELGQGPASASDRGARRKFASELGQGPAVPSTSDALARSFAANGDLS